jgi:hypothetical protein
VQWLIRGVKNDYIQVQTTIGIIRDRYLWRGMLDVIANDFLPIRKYRTR